MKTIMKCLNVVIAAAVLLSSLAWSPAVNTPVQAQVVHGTLYVMPGGVGGCSSWADSCDLQSALTGAIAVDKIWAAAGTYYPGPAGSRTATFQLKTGVEVYGGFDDGDTTFEERDWAANPTILSGDIDKNGIRDDGNAYHVVSAVDADASAILDGFTVSGGSATGSNPNNLGAGMYNVSSPRLTNVTFSGNYAGLYGGGMYTAGGSPALKNVTFSANSAGGWGGGMYNASGAASLEDVAFINNSIINGGCGGLYNGSSSLTLTNATFSGNSSLMGGGMCNFSSSPTLTNVTFSGNSAGMIGGGLYNQSSSPNLYNVTFFGNTNSGIKNTSNSGPTLTNSILWGNTPDQINNEQSTAMVIFSDVQGGYTGTGNISDDPLLGPLADNGGYTQTHALLPGSPAIDTGDNESCPATDQRGIPRPRDGNEDGSADCDMGAFEVSLGLVVNANDSVDDGVCDASHCSLVEAVNYAAKGDTIKFAPALSGAVFWYYPTLNLNRDMTIDASSLSLPVTINGRDCFGSLEVAEGANVTLKSLEISETGCSDDPGQGAVVNRGTLTLNHTRLNANILAVNNQGNLTVTDSVIENSVNESGWGISCESGQVDISGSMLRGNYAGGIFVGSACYADVITSSITGNAKGISNYGTLSLQNVTLSDNTGEGIFNAGNLTLENVTIAKNESGLINDYMGSMDFTNTLAANNTSGDCQNTGFVATNNHNLVGDGTCDALLSGEPMLGDLLDNGGGTLTRALQPGSPAIDAGDNTACLATDQRGYARPWDGDENGAAACDIGAFEVSYGVKVNRLADDDDGSCSASHCTLREAIAAAPSGFTIVFDPGLSGETIEAAETLSIGGNVTIDASTLPEPVRISGNNTMSVFSITYATVEMKSLEITNGGNGAIFSYNGNLTLTNVRVADNFSGYNGGGINNDSGTLTIIDSTIENNSATIGGGIFSHTYGNVTISGSTIRNNLDYGGAGGYAEIIPGSTVLITNSTFSGNSNGAISTFGDLTLQNVTITGTTGNGITNNGTLAFSNTLIANSTGADCVNNAAINANNHNLVEDGSCAAPFSGDPQLGPLEDNGGPTLTHALLPGSPAIDAGDGGACPAIDQRGFTRPKDGNEDGLKACDIGAFELSYERDFGDAPAPYPTLKSQNGASHFVRDGFYLGAQIDVDLDGHPSANADGDDLDNQDDEDGVAFPSELRSGQTAAVNVTLTGSGYLHAWIDFNRDGDWADTGEKIVPGVYNTGGTHSFSFQVPPDAATGTTYARFRFTSRPNLSYDGVAVDGEVEDYAVPILRGYPVANPDSASLDEGSSVLIDVLANDYDPHGTVNIDSVGSAAHGTAAIESGKVRYTPNANYSGPDSFAYTIANDIGLTASARVTLFVTNVNTAPTDIQIFDPQALRASCNSSEVCTLPSGTLVGTLVAVDPDPGDKHLFNLVDSPSFRITGVQLFTQADIVFSGSTQTFEKKVKVSVTDSGSLSFTKEITLVILGSKVGGGPESITLDAYQVLENQPAGTLVGNLGTVETTPHAPYTYAIVSGEGSGDNAKFQIDGSRLETAGPLDFEQKELNKVRIRTQNSFSQSWEQVFTIQLMDDPNEPPPLYPANCSGADIELISTKLNSDDVTMKILEVLPSNRTAQGCTVQGKLSLSVPGWSGDSIAFTGQVNKSNEVTAAPGSIGVIDMEVAGVPLKVKTASLEYSDGHSGLRLGNAAFCLPSGWGGLCAPALGDGVSLLVDDGGLRIGGGLSFGFPDIKIASQLGLNALKAKLIALPGGYELSLIGSLGLPKFKSGSSTNQCSISASVRLFFESGGAVMEIDAGPASVDSVKLREVYVGASCDTGIPIDSTGLALTGVEGTVRLEQGDSFVSIKITIATVKKIPVLNISPVKAEGTATVMWDPQWGLDLTSAIYLLEVFKTAETTVSVRENRFSFTANVTSFLVNGSVSFNAWTDWASFHLTGSGRVDVGLLKGSVLHQCVCVPYPTRVCWKWFVPYPCGWKSACGCLDIPPFNLVIGVGSEFGEFTNGAWGFKGYVDLGVLGTYGIYVDTKPSLHIGGVNQYKLVTPPAIAEALWKYRFERGLGLQTVEPAPGASISDIQVASDHQMTFRVPVNVKSGENITAGEEVTPVELDTQKDTLFSVSSSDPLLGMTLEAPDGTVITPDNYNQPPVTPDYTVDYQQQFVYQPNTPEDPNTADQPRLRFVLAATHPDWAVVNVSLDGVLLYESLSLDDPAPVEYIPINAGEHTLSIVPSGGGTPVNLSFSTDFQKKYTFLASGNGSTPDLIKITDIYEFTRPNTPGKALLRFVHSAPYPNPVDVRVNGVEVLSDATYLAQNAYREFAAGEALVEIKDSASGIDIAPAQVIELAAGGIYSLFDALYPVGEYQLAWGQYLDESFVERYYTNYKVRLAPPGEWLVTLDGNLDTSMPFVSALGIANPPQWERVEVQASDPFHPELTWELQSGYLPTKVAVYANPAEYESGGDPVYQGVQVAEVELTEAGDLNGDPFLQAVDLSALESGSYRLWVRVQDGVNPPALAYAQNPGGGVAVFTINQAASFPTAWNPAITTQLSSAQNRLFLEWGALDHPDADSYNLYLNTLPDTPVLYVEGLSASRATDASGTPIGPPLVNTSASELVPGTTYYYSVEAVNADGGSSVRSPEASITVAYGDFRLDTPSGQYLVPPASQASFPLALKVLAPLFYPNVGLSVDESQLPPGMRARFDTPLEGDAYLNADIDTVMVLIEVGSEVDSGIYPVTFTGSSGDMKRSRTVYVLVNPAPTDLGITGNYLLWGQDRVTFIYTVTNLGLQPGDGVQVSVPFPAGLSQLTWSCLGSGSVICGSGTGDVLDWIGNFQPGDTATYTVTGTHQHFKSFKVRAELTWLGGDTNPANNQADLEWQSVFIPAIRK